MRPNRIRVYGMDGNVLAVVKVPASGPLVFTPTGKVSSIAMFSGKVEDEVCQGEVVGIQPGTEAEITVNFEG